MSMPATNAEHDQKALFDRLAAQYELHYSDEWSLRYRDTFFYGPLFEGIDLSGKRVLEAMCGSVQTTMFLRARGAKVTGIDISSGQIEFFRQRWADCDAVCGSIFDTGFDDASFDCVVVVLGLHHLHPQLPKAIDEIHRILKPGGYFCFIEPHAGSMPDVLRKVWYRVDTAMFERNEGAIDLAQLEALNAARFRFVKTKYMGNAGYLLVLCSLILRIPVRLKKLYAPSLLKIEAIVERLQGKKLSCLAIGQWKKAG